MKNLIIVALLLIIAGLTWLLFSPKDYYEYQADSVAECLAGELFDEEAQVCYFDYYCETEAECSEIDARYGALLTALAEEYQSTQNGLISFGSAPQNGAIVDDEIDSVNLHPSSVRAPRSIQELMSVLLPADDAARIIKYEKNSDGPDGILAYVEPASPDGSTWSLGYDPVDSFNEDGSLKNPRQLMTTLIHEYMHIVSLNHSQVSHVSPHVEYIECETGQVILNEGCAIEQSYIAKFVLEFWDDETREAAYQAFVDQREEDFSYELYDKNQSHFVTEYAATNAVEDIAESFAMFVMRDRNANPLTVADRKTDFFYAFPKLVALRKHMRGGLAKVLGNI